MIYMVALKRAFFGVLLGHSLLGAGVLGDGLGALRDGMLGQLSGQEEPDDGLDLPGGDGGPLVVVGKLLDAHYLRYLVLKVPRHICRCISWGT